MSGGDETYLEAIVENLSTLPSELKRNMELLKDLDGSTSVGIEKMVQLQQAYLNQAGNKLMQLEIVVQSTQPPNNSSDKKRKAPNDDDGTDDDAATETTKGKAIDDDANSKGNDVGAGAGTEPLATATTTAAGKAAESDNKSTITTTATKVGVRVLGGKEDDENDPRSKAVVIPTILELQQYIDDPQLYEQIQLLQDEVIRKSNLKVAVANQVHHRITTIVQRLDRVLADFAKLLQSSGDLAIGLGGIGGTGASALIPSKVNDLAACQVTPGSEWILAKVLHHDPNTGMYQLADEDIESNKIFHLPESQVILCGVDKLSKGDVVFAVYPDTTSFYQATVVQAPRKNAVSQGASHTSTSLFAMVNFVDDSDEFGITHDKAIPLKHIIYPPFGATLVK